MGKKKRAFPIITEKSSERLFSFSATKCLVSLCKKTTKLVSKGAPSKGPSKQLFIGEDPTFLQWNYRGVQAN